MARRLCIVALLALALAACGSAVDPNTQSPGDQLTIYSSLPLQGPLASVSQSIVNAEKLALLQHGGRVGRFSISYYSLDDSTPGGDGGWNQNLTAANAKVAAQDKTTIAYLGDFDSGATALSLPLINAEGILQISPSSPYVGLTSSHDAGQDEPDRFYLSGERTFGRVAPGDLVEGEAQASLMTHLGVHEVYILSDLDPNDFAGPLAQIVAQDAQAAGIKVASVDLLDMTATNYAGEVKKVVQSGADAVFYAGAANLGAAALWEELYAAEPSLKLLGSHTFDVPTFTAGLGLAGGSTYFTTPVLATRLYPPIAQRFFADYRREYGYPAPADALYGYEAMEDALQAVRMAGAQGNVRRAVVEAFFHIRKSDSVLGPYSILPSGDTSLTDYGVDRIVDGAPSFMFEVHGSMPSY